VFTYTACYCYCCNHTITEQALEEENLEGLDAVKKWLSKIYIFGFFESLDGAVSVELHYVHQHAMMLKRYARKYALLSRTLLVSGT
jgi:hypothetical protein